MADPLFDQLSASTLAELERDVAYDNFFVKGAWQRIMRYYMEQREFTGGLFMQVPFQYDRVNGGAYTPASDVQVIQKQILGAMQFSPKAYKEDVPLNLWQTDVINNGPAAMVSLADAYFENAIEAMSTDLNIDFFWHGQLSGTNIAQNRIININGADEACNNGTDPGWLGNIYSTYGGQTRNGVVNSTLNGQVFWAGDQSGNAGQTNYGIFLDSYLSCVQSPDTGLGNKAVFGYFLKRLQPQQRFVQESGSDIVREKDSRIGLSGIRFLEAIIHVDKLAPSTKFGAILPSDLSQSVSLTPNKFTTPSAPTTASNYPASTSCNPGEPFFWLRLQDWMMRFSGAPEYNGFTPDIRTQTNPDLIVKFYKRACECYTPSPRDNSQIVGFGY
jgi:hypothetical protein